MLKSGYFYCVKKNYCNPTPPPPPVSFAEFGAPVCQRFNNLETI